MAELFLTRFPYYANSGFGRGFKIRYRLLCVETPSPQHAYCADFQELLVLRVWEVKLWSKNHSAVMATTIRSVDLIHGADPWIRSMDQTSGSDPWIRSMIRIHGSDTWIRSMDQIHGSDPWTRSMDQILGSDPRIKSMDPIHGSDPRI